MARRSAADKAETHEKIVERAGRAFRSHGSGVGITDVMGDLGLTHGGFYRHFESKDDLLVEAVSRSLAEVAERLERIAQKAAPGHELEAIVTAYLSTDHVKHPEQWCALATLAADIGRQPHAIKKRIDVALAGYLERMLAYMPGADDEERSRAFVILFSGMSGAVALARAFADKDRRDYVLAAARAFYLAAFTSTVRT